VVGGAANDSSGVGSNLDGRSVVDGAACDDLSPFGAVGVVVVGEDARVWRSGGVDFVDAGTTKFCQNFSVATNAINGASSK
jgi:hypothetical protein